MASRRDTIYHERAQGWFFMGLRGYPDRIIDNVFSGSIGLFVRRGKGAFRNVKITKALQQNN
jgi:hypothetical protein